MPSELSLNPWRRFAATACLMALAGCQAQPSQTPSAWRAGPDWPEDNTAPLVPPAPADAQPCELTQVADLPIHLQQSHMLVDVTINDQPARMVLDTGSETTTLTPEAARRLRLHPSKAVAGYVLGIGGTRRAAIYHSNNIRIGFLHGRTWDFVVTDIAAGAFHPPLDGLLGADLLHNYDIDLDLAGGRLGLFYAAHDCVQPNTILTGPLHTADLEITRLPNAPLSSDSRALLTVHVQIGAHALVAAIDTGAPDNVLFVPGMTKLHWTVADIAGGKRGQMGGIGPYAVHSLDHVLPMIGIGDLLLTTVPVKLVGSSMGPGGPDMLIGLNMLRRVHVWISHSAAKVIMQAPALPSPPLPAETAPAPKA